MDELEGLRIKDRAAKLAKAKGRMVVHGAALKNPDLQKVLLSGRRARTKALKKKLR